MFYRWDSTSRTWTMMTPMTTARTGHGAVLLQNKIYVVGGKTGTETGTYHKSVEAYDFKNDVWTSKASLNNANAYFGVRTWFDFFYIDTFNIPMYLSILRNASTDSDIQKSNIRCRRKQRFCNSSQQRGALWFCRKYLDHNCKYFVGGGRGTFQHDGR